MRLVFFAARVTFIFNIFFIVCLLMRHTHIAVPQGMQEMIIIQGWLLSVVFNILFGSAIILLRTRRIATPIPNWLILANLGCMVFQVGYYVLIG